MHAVRAILAALLVLALTGTAVLRNARWHSLLAMWEDCAGKSPDKSRTHNNLGNCYLLLGRHFSALAEYQRAVAIEPRNLEAQYNLATTLDTVGLLTQAIGPYDVFCRQAPPAFAEQRAKACARLRELLAAARSGAGGKDRP
jgi:tetratricopeptide (TPR) repeat protein